MQAKFINICFRLLIGDIYIFMHVFKRSTEIFCETFLEMFSISDGKFLILCGYFNHCNVELLKPVTKRHAKVAANVHFFTTNNEELDLTTIASPLRTPSDFVVLNTSISYQLHRAVQCAASHSTHH